MSKLNLNGPSMFRRGGMETVMGRTEAGKNADGSYYIEIQGRTTERSTLTPRQAFDLAVGLLRAQGYPLDHIAPPC